MTVLLDDRNYYTGGFAVTGGIEGGVQVEELPPNDGDYRAYRLVDGVWEFDVNKAKELEIEYQQIEIRQYRAEAFEEIDLLQLAIPFSKLDDSQKLELINYRQAWLDAPETLFIPQKPQFMR